VELDEIAEEGLQDALERVSGLSTVPNVYIGKDHLLPFSYVVVTLVVFCSKP
jgi:glutaredoxin